jgi:hypothetical protein
MRGTRKVYDLLDECTRALSEPFERAQILAWFRRHHPEVSERTVGTHVQALTANVPDRARMHPGLGRRPPLLERVGRGTYVRFRDQASGSSEPQPHRVVPEQADRLADRPLSPQLTPSSPVEASSRAADFLLVGCVKTKLPHAAPARDLFSSTHFRAARAYVETTGLPWYVLSAKYGLLAPDEVVQPYDVFLKDMSSAYRRAWGEWVVQQLLRERVDLAGTTFAVHAGESYVAPLRGPFARAQARLVEPLQGLSLGERTRWHQQHTGSVADPEAALAENAVTGDGETSAAADQLVRALASGRESRSPQEFARDQDPAMDGPGLYTWWVDEPGAADLSRGLGVPVELGLIYAGQAGATRWPSGRRSCNTLRQRIDGMHLGSRAEFSTFRRTLAAALTPALGLDSDDDARLSSWMDEHLRVVTAPVPDPDTLGRVERAVLEQLDPPLNLQHMAPSPVRRVLREARRRRGLSVEPEGDAD